MIILVIPFVYQILTCMSTAPRSLAAPATVSRSTGQEKLEEHWLGEDLPTALPEERDRGERLIKVGF